MTAGNGPWWLTTRGAVSSVDPITLSAAPAAAVRARHVHVLEIGRVALQSRVDLEDDSVLVARGVDGGDLPLREGVVERVVDGIDAHPEPCGGVAIDLDVELESAGLRSFETSTSPGICFMRSRIFGAHSKSSSMSGSHSVYWYWELP